MPNTDLPDDEIMQPEPDDTAFPEDDLPEEPLIDRRTAIAQARAIRREAAALEQAEKEKAAETANSILELAGPEPKRSIRRQMAPIPVSVTTGKFSWLDDVKKLKPAQSDAEEIVEQLVAESRQRDAEPAAEDLAEAKQVDPADLLEHIITEVQNPHAPEAIVAQVLRESAAASAAQELIPEPDGEPAASAEAAEQESADEPVYAPEEPFAADDADPDSAAEADAAEYDDEAAEEPAEYNEETAEASAEYYEEYADEPAEYFDDDAEESAAYFDDDTADAAEYDDYGADDDTDYADEAEYEEYDEYADEPEPVRKPVRRMPVHVPPCSDEEASAQYRAAVRDGRAGLKKQTRRSNRAWNREAAGIRAKLTGEKTARQTAKWNVGICLTVLFGVAVGMLVLERPTVSMEENRTLAKMPEFTVEDYLDGKYTAGVAEYYNDTVPGRSTLKGWVQEIRKCMGLRSEVSLHGSGAVQQPVPAETTVPVPETTAPRVTAVTLYAAEEIPETTTTTAAPEPEEPEREGEISNNILIVDKRGIMLFGGWETMGETYAANVNRFKESLPNVNMYSMVVPTPCSYYTPEDFQYLITSEKANIDYINRSLVNVTPVDVYSALEKHKDEPIFMRTDHHWTSLGAFYGAEVFSAAARVPFARIDEYDRHSKDGYVGTLYGFSNDIILKENPEEFFWYVPKKQFRTEYYNRSFGFEREGDFFMDIENVAPVSWYMVYMAGDDHVLKITSDVGNGRKLCVIKDSYGNALIPWLTSSFDEIYVIDMRYFNLNAVQFIKDQGITDVLFAMNSFSANGPNTDKIETIRVQ